MPKVFDVAMCHHEVVMLYRECKAGRSLTRLITAWKVAFVTEGLGLLRVSRKNTSMVLVTDRRNRPFSGLQGLSKGSRARVLGWLRAFSPCLCSQGHRLSSAEPVAGRDSSSAVR